MVVVQSVRQSKSRSRRPLVWIAVVIVVLASTLVFASLDGDSSHAGQVVLVKDFFAAVNSGEVEAAIELVDPTFRSSDWPGVTEAKSDVVNLFGLPDLLGFFVAIEGSVEVDGCAPVAEDLRCRFVSQSEFGRLVGSPAAEGHLTMASASGRITSLDVVYTRGPYATWDFDAWAATSAANGRGPAWGGAEFRYEPQDVDQLEPRVEFDLAEYLFYGFSEYRFDEEAGRWLLSQAAVFAANQLQATEDLKRIRSQLTVSAQFCDDEGISGIVENKSDSRVDVGVAVRLGDLAGVRDVAVTPLRLQPWETQTWGVLTPPVCSVSPMCGEPPTLFIAEIADPGSSQPLSQPHTPPP